MLLERLRDLLLAVAVLAVPSAVAEWWILDSTVGICRLRDFSLPWLARNVLELLGIPVLRWQLLSEPWSPRVGSQGLTRFLPSVLLQAGLLAALAIPTLLWQWRRSERGAGTFVSLLRALATGWLMILGSSKVFLVARGEHPAAVALLAALAGALAIWLLARGSARLSPAVQLALVGVVCCGLVYHTSVRTNWRTPLGSQVAKAASLPVESPPVVVLVSIDSLRADHMGCYGYDRDTTPFLDSIAAEGVTYSAAIAASSWTLPTHITMLTGLEPTEHGVRTDGSRLALDVLTLPEVLQAHGWQTAAIVSAPYLDARYGLFRGFESYDDFSVPIECGNGPHRWFTGPTLEAAVERVLEDRRDRDDPRPLFLFLHLWDTHYDYVPPAPFDRLFDPNYAGSVDGRNFELGAAVHPEMAERDLQHVVALYDGEIRGVDSSLQRVAESLEAHGLWRDCLFAVTADHGDEFFEHGNKGHRKTLFEESVRVPLIVRDPRARSNASQVGQPVGHAEIPRLLLDAIGIAVPPSMSAQASQIAEPGGDLSSVALSELEFRLASARTRNFKYIRDAEDGERWLFDLRVDPGEQHNAVDAHPEFVAALDRWLSERLERGSTSVGAESLSLDSRHRKMLEELGYLEPQAVR